jgi:uncharacterized protein (TIGR02284 family)
MDALTSIDSWIEPKQMIEPRQQVMNAQISILKSLVISLDEARMFYSDAVRNVTHPCLKQCFERIVHTHLTIADDLADRIDGMGGSVARDGSCMTALHLRWAAWRVRISHDAETGYVKEAGKREARVRRGFRIAGRCTPDPGLRDRIKCHLRDIEHVDRSIDNLAAMMPMQTIQRPVHVDRGFSSAGGTASPVIACSGDTRSGCN